MESIPLDQAIAEDLYRWLSIQTFESCEPLFRYHLSDEEYQKFRADFLAKRRTTPAQRGSEGSNLVDVRYIELRILRTCGMERTRGIETE
jgi:hypothetical protein